MKMPMWCVCLVVLSCFVVSESKKAKKGRESVVLGIDFGTRNSRAALFNNVTEKVEVIVDEYGRRSIPNYVVFFANNSKLVGHNAKRHYWGDTDQLTSATDQQHHGSTTTLYDIKRLIDRGMVKQAVQEDFHQHWQQTFITHTPVFKVNAGSSELLLTPENVTAEIFIQLKYLAEKQLNTGETIKTAVVTVPAYFTFDQRDIIKDAGRLADLNVIRIINEPTAAMVACRLDFLEGEHIVLLYDLGATTLDITIALVDNGVMEILPRNRYDIGGDTFVTQAADYFYSQLPVEELGWRDKIILKRSITRQVESANIYDMTADDSTEIIIPLVLKQNNKFTGVLADNLLTRAKFDALNHDLYKSTLDYVTSSLEEAKADFEEELTATNISHVILLGGAVKSVEVQNLIKTYFHGKELFCLGDIEADELIVHGAAMQAEVVALDDGSDVTAYGFDEYNWLDYGVEVADGRMSVILPRRTIWGGARKARNYTVAADFQDSVAVKIFEGLRPFTKNNHYMRQLNLTGLQPGLKADTQIEITFDYDVNGILHVSAEETRTGRIVKTSIGDYDAGQPYERISAEEVERMMDEADAFVEEDSILKQLEENNELMAASGDSNSIESDSKRPERLKDDL